MGTSEYHNLCDHCGDLLVLKELPGARSYIYEFCGEIFTAFKWTQPIHCDSCGHDMPNGVQDGDWRFWEDSEVPDWAGCA